MRRFWIWMNIIYEKCMLVLFFIALLFVLYGLYDTWYVYNRAEDDSYLKYKPVAGQTVPEDAPITEDMVAWITIDGTNIDYPVMQGDNNMKYLNLNPYGEYSLAGSIYLDSRNKADFSDDYSILYGHHMEYGVMFGALDEFLSLNYLKAHDHGTLLIGSDGHESHELGIFACMKVNVSDYKVLDPIPLSDLYEMIEERAAAIDPAVRKSNRILALSTCTEQVSSDRLLVFCYIYD